LRWEQDFALAWKVTPEDHFSIDGESRKDRQRLFSGNLEMVSVKTPVGNALAVLALKGYGNAPSCHCQPRKGPTILTKESCKPMQLVAGDRPVKGFVGVTCISP
jgi:hypothetical protein